MKSLKTRLLLRLVAVTSLAAFSPQVFAANTPAGTPIDNTVDVTFEINGLTQDAVSAAAPQFLVDRIVNFTLDPTDAVNTEVTPNEQNAVASFTLTNTSNSPLDFNLSAANLADGADANGSPDDADMGATFEFSVNNAVSGVLDFVDGLAPGDSVQIDVLSDAPITLTDAQVAAIRLTVTAALSAATQDSTPGPTLVASGSDTANVIDTVFDAAVASGVNGVLTADDGYVVAAANLSVTKSSSVVFDPINLTTAPLFAIPGAIVEYTLVLSNASATVAENVSISDDLQAALIFEANDLPLGTGNVSVEIGGTTTYCTAEVGGDANTDGCFLTGSVLTIGGIDNSGSTVVPLDVGADDATIIFRALIDNTP